MNSFNFLKKIGKIFSGTCWYYVGKRYKCDGKRDEKCPTGFDFLAPFWEPFPLKIQSKIHQKIDNEKTLKKIAKGFQNGTETEKAKKIKILEKKYQDVLDLNSKEYDEAQQEVCA